MARQWQFRVRHILEAIQRVESYTQDMEFSEFSQNPLVIDAVIRNLQVIGEASRLVPEEIQTKYPHVPWQLMRGMRNVFVHDYERIDPAILWQTVRSNLPPLRDQLLKIVRTQD